MAKLEPTDVTHFPSPREFRDWLHEHHSERDVLWVGFWKKATGRPSLTWEESVDEALCYGWIDGIRKRLDDEAYTIRFTPRREGSTWSRRNIEQFERLEREGRIEQPGRAAYEQRTEDNSGIYSFEQDEPPTLSDEYLARLRSDEAAWADWAGRPPGYQRQVSHWVMSAKREATRERRLAALIEDCRNGQEGEAATAVAVASAYGRLSTMALLPVIRTAMPPTGRRGRPDVPARTRPGP